MKALVSLGLACLAGVLVAESQTSSSTPAAAQNHTGLPASPASAGLPISPSTTTSPLIQQARAAEPATGGNSSAGVAAGPLGQRQPAFADLGTVLMNTQVQLEQALASLSAVTHSAGAPSLQTSATPSAQMIGTALPTSAATTVATSGQNLSTAAGVNLSARTAGNLSVNASVPAGATAPAMLPGSAAQNLNIVTGPGAAGAQPAPTLTLSRDTLQALQLLQAEVQRLLPIVAAVNRGEGYSAIANNGAVNSIAQDQQALTPTGRSNTGRPAPPGGLRVITQ